MGTASGAGKKQVGARMKVLILGASGIIGQHMRLCVPDSVTAMFCNRQGDLLHEPVDLADTAGIRDRIGSYGPQVVVNLAGENNPDTVEHDPAATRKVNVLAAQEVAAFCAASKARHIYVSSQAVFGGDTPPYSASSPLAPVNAYGWQKAEAESMVRAACPLAAIVRPTFVLGVRPLPCVGRANPVEQMLAGQPRQVADRWFSPLFARDAAILIWRVVQEQHSGEIIHLGIPRRTSRYEIAQALGCEVESARHDGFPGIAPRPVDTTYAQGSWYLRGFHQGLAECRQEWESRRSLDTSTRAREIALFLGIREAVAYTRLQGGFLPLHADVAADFRRTSPKNDADLLRWYRQTESYIWELSAFHCDQGYNYMGMCRGIEAHLQAAGARRVLCLGDGIGDLALALRRGGIEALYHDLNGSRTAAFAAFRYWMHTGQSLPVRLTDGWEPALSNGSGGYDAVVSLDFLEHVTDVPAWTRAIRDVLVPSGLFCAWNAFGCGSGDNGSIPMHLTRNDRYEKEWDPLLAQLGLRQKSSNWYVRL